MDIKQYREQNLLDLVEVFYASVHAIETHYTPAQRDAWAPQPIDYTFWKERLHIKQPWTAWVESKCVGFIELDPDGQIDCMYVHPCAQGQGIASALYQTLETSAREKGISLLTVQASYLAEPIFKHWGFVKLKENKIERCGEVLVNFTMEKKIN